MSATMQISKGDWSGGIKRGLVHISRKLRKCSESVRATSSPFVAGCFEIWTWPLFVPQYVDFTYDVFDRRLYKTIDPDGAGAQAPQSDLFVHDGDHVVLQLRDSDGTGSQVAPLTHRYLHGPEIDMILADEQDLGTPGFTLWGLADQLGTVREVNSKGTGPYFKEA